VREQEARFEEHARTTTEALISAGRFCDGSTHGWGVDEDGWPLEGVKVTVTLVEQPFDFMRFRGPRESRDKAASSALTAERRAQLAPIQDAFEQSVVELGGRVTMNLLSTNTVQVIIPVCQVDTLAAFYDVVALEIDEDDETRMLGADGLDRSEALGIPAAGLAGLDAGQGSWQPGQTRVRYGVIDGDRLNTSHRSFFDDSGSNIRIVDTDRCERHPPWLVVRCILSATTTSSSHGTSVTHILLGDATDFQNPALTTSIERQRRSGIAREAEVHYYRALASDGTAKAFEEAAFDNGVDIINLSLAPPSSATACALSSHSGVRGAIEAATDAGVLVVVAAGNDGDDEGVGSDSCFDSGSPPSGWNPACTVSAFGYYPDSMTVGGTEPVGSLSFLDSIAPERCSSSGSVAVTLAGGRASNAFPIDVATNESHSFVASNGTNNYKDVAGTSFAAPVIAGVAGLLADWVHDRGGFGVLGNDPYFYRTFISWMADGRGDFDGTPVEWNSTIDSHFGFGNVRFADVDNLGAGSGFGLRRVTLAQNSTLEWWVGSSSPKSTSINGWKFAALVDLNDYAGAPDIKIELIDTCPPGGGTTVLKTATRNALKYRLRLYDSELATKFWGRCTKVRVTVEHATSSFLFYAADGFYTGARVNHESEIF